MVDAGPRTGARLFIRQKITLYPLILPSFMIIFPLGQGCLTAEDLYP